VIQAITQYLIHSQKLEDVNMTSTLYLNSNPLENQTFSNKNKLTSFTKSLNFSTLKDQNQLTFQTKGAGTLYYDMTMKYYLPSL
jgi:hypothetical protein